MILSSDFGCLESFESTSLRDVKWFTEVAFPGVETAGLNSHYRYAVSNMPASLRDEKKWLCGFPGLERPG